MSLLSRMAAPTATDDVAKLVAGLLARPGAAAELPGRAAAKLSGRVPSSVRAPSSVRIPSGPTGLGTSALRVTPREVGESRESRDSRDS
ncbi:hypothetical protein K6I34_006069, partial [Streptomyces sp. UNOC14_S4]|nr:hypothetical protein [Streptomyces sp. UNOC14_S4]